MLAQNASLLTDAQVQTIHEASLAILEEVGLLVHNPVAREVFEDHGCRVDTETQIVRFPPGVVEHWRQAFPNQFRFFGRDPKYDITLPDDGPVITTAGTAPNLLDLETGEVRRATLGDIAHMAHLINQLPGFDIFSIPTLADDAPQRVNNLARFYVAAKNCLKPVRSHCWNPQEADDIIHMGEIVAGGVDAYWKRPFLHFSHCSVISPLTMDYDSTGLCMHYARRGITALAVLIPNGGLTAPLTMAGTLVVTNAEFLAINVLAQMAQERTPVIYYTLPTITDVRTGAYASGGIECGILHMACAQLARFYDVPCGGLIGLTNAKLSDAQAGFEKGMSPLAGMLAGQDLLTMGGLVDAVKVFSFPQAVIDSEIGEMIKRVHRGIPFDKDQLALELIKEIGPGGSYIDSQHTLRHMRRTAYLPTIADRRPWEEWSDAGRPDTQARAMQRVRDILSSDNPAGFSPDVDVEIRKAFGGLLAGDSVLTTDQGIPVHRVSQHTPSPRS
jgi:trimethylamine--corrinoid protein Co-methyltransferase